jgi:hypothetical protein
MGIPFAPDRLNLLSSRRPCGGPAPRHRCTPPRLRPGRAPCPGQHLGWPPPASASVNICLLDPLHPCLSISAAARPLQCLHRCGSRRALPGGGGVGVAVVCVGAAALRAGAVTGRMRATRGVVGARREPVLPAGLSARIFSGFPQGPGSAATCRLRVALTASDSRRWLSSSLAFVASTVAVVRRGHSCVTIDCVPTPASAPVLAETACRRPSYMKAVSDPAPWAWMRSRSRRLRTGRSGPGPALLLAAGPDWPWLAKSCPLRVAPRTRGPVLPAAESWRPVLSTLALSLQAAPAAVFNSTSRARLLLPGGPALHVGSRA